MDENAQNSQTLFPHETGHHRSARERQRRGPMWGCLRALILLFAGVFILLIVVIGGGWWYLGSASFAELVRLRVEKTLEARLGRDVSIGSIAIDKKHLSRVAINDLRVANAPGGVNRYFATVRQVVITGGVDSFWRRSIKVGRVDIVDPVFNFEIFPAGSKLTHNFPHWESGPRSKYEIVHLAINKMYVSGGRFTFLDRRHQINAASDAIASTITVTRAEDLYAGMVTSPRVTVRIQDYEPFDLDLRGGFRYTPGVLALSSVAMRGRDMQLFLSGRLDPLNQGVYDLRLTSEFGLSRIREIFRVQKVLQGTLAIDSRLRGKQGEFVLAGGWASGKIIADTYELTNARGRLNVNGERTLVDIEQARYGGGNVTGHYSLSKYAEPYPMNVRLHYDRVSIERLFSDWGVEDTGLRGAATGNLDYGWNKDKILEGAGSGSATLSKSAVAFSSAKYPIPVAGSTDFSLNRGVVTFRSLNLNTDASEITATGTLRIEDVFTDLRLHINSSDFSELDRAGYNFAHSAGKKTYTLLGLGGSGEITGTMHGRIKAPAVVAHISGSSTKYNNVLLGAADIDLHYDGIRSVLTFDRAGFALDGGKLALAGTVAFPDRGPSPQFDLAVEAAGYPVDRAIEAVNLDMKIAGIGTGRMIVTGTPESGKVTFAGMTIQRGESQLRLAGDVAWAPGKGNVRFNLDLAARSFPVSDIVTFLDLGTVPITGELTGTLHLEGLKSALEGAGAITVRRGSVFGEPVNVASADILFTQGRLRATNVSVSAPAGEIKGEAELNLGTNQFSYTITSSSIDLSQLQLLKTLKGLLGGKVILTSSGAGTFDRPELVIEARLTEATIRGLLLPPDAAPPTIYIAIRDGRLIVRGSVADLLTVEGDGAIGKDLAVDGLVRITVTDIARLLALSATSATIPASGNAVIDLRLGGKLSSLEALRIDATVPTLNLRVSEHDFTPSRPFHLVMAGGRIDVVSFDLQRPDSIFSVRGFAEITGAKRLGLQVNGSLEAALLQLFMRDLRADGHVALTVNIGGTTTDPRVTGNADLQNAQVKFAGFPQLIDEINGRITFNGDSIGLEGLSATVGGGTVRAGGSVGLNGLKPSRIRLSFRGTGVALRYFEGVTVEGDFTLDLVGDMERMALQGNVDVKRALYFRDFDLRQSILNVILSRRGITPVVAASWQNRVDLRIRLNAPPDTLAVHNNMANVTGTAELDVAGTLANPVVLGAVTLNEGGTVTFQNTDYRVVRGTINFQNPFRIDPYFDVTLEGRASGGISEIESGPLDVTINITGTLDRITPSISSDPPASDITLFSLLGFGSLARGPAGATAGPNASLLGQSLLESSVFSALGQRILPFADSFTYDPGLLDTGGSGPNPRVSFEKRISNDVRVLVVYNLDSHQSREVVEWMVDRDWTLQLTRDETADEYRVDARFRQRYLGRWRSASIARPAEIFPVSSLTTTAAAALPPAPPTTRVETTPGGTVVADVRFHSDGPFDTSALAQYVTVRSGQPLSIRDVQSSVKALFATGNFRDIRVDASPGPNTIVTFALSLNFRVGRITFDGLGGSSRTQAERSLTVRPGDVLSLNAVDRSAVAITAELSRRGYLEATVDPETTFDRERNLADVIFHVNGGPLAKVGSVAIEGNLQPFTYDELLKTMRAKPGSAFQLNGARADADRIRNYIVRHQHRRARVDLASHTYDPATDSVALRYVVETGPVVRVDVAGVPRSAVRKLLPFHGNQEFSEDAVDRAADAMIRMYQERGYFRAAVDTESHLADNTWVTTFTVSPGQRYTLRDVTFTGNLKLSDKELTSVVQTTPRGGFRRLLSTIFRRPSGVTSAQLTEDRDAVESHYRLKGFAEATVDSPAPIARADGTLTIDFPVTEGPQTMVSDVRVEGVEQVRERDLPKLQLRAGDALNPQLEREDVISLQTWYSDRGNAEVQITPRVELNQQRTAARVVYTVAEGPQVHIGEVIVRGNTYTDSVVVSRKSELRTGAPFSYGSILEAQRNLYRLGIFNRVDVQPEQTGTSVGDRNVVIQVEEGNNLTVSGSVGMRAKTGSQDRKRDISPRVAAAIAHRNLFGTGRYIGLEGVWSQEEKEGFLTYREPFIGRFNVPVQLSIFQTDDQTTKERRLRQSGTSVEASKVAFLRTRWSLQYQYKISRCVAGQVCELARTVITPQLDKSQLDIKISRITPTFFWDKRDDIVDPHRGFFTSASVEYAFPLPRAVSGKQSDVFAQGAWANFTKEFVQGAWYLPVSARSVFALSSRVGFIQPIGYEYIQTAQGLVRQRTPIPLSERFTVGGDTSHRAYPIDLLGTLCTDEERAKRPGCQPTLIDLDGDPNSAPYRLAPLGGSGLLVVNAEYRFPIVGAVGGALFSDVGNVFGTNTIRFDELRYGVGAGIRYISPVGPLRLDIGWPMNRRAYDRPFAYSLTLGYAF